MNKSNPAAKPALALSKEERYQQLMTKYEISKEYADKLKKLSNFKIVCIFDDSSSMTSTLDESPLNDVFRFGVLKATRWDELQYFANISIEIANFFNDNESSHGTDVYFLNKPPVKSITNVDQFMNHLRMLKPNGYTPLNKIFNVVLNDNISLLKERKLLIIILTDGEPSDDQGESDLKGFKKSLLTRSPINRIFVNMIVCTDDKDSVSYLNRMDREIFNLDVIDDYNSEKKEVKRKKGLKHSFTYGDYVAKALVGSVDLKMDRSDENYNSDCLIS